MKQSNKCMPVVPCYQCATDIRDMQGSGIKIAHTVEGRRLLPQMVVLLRAALIQVHISPAKTLKTRLVVFLAAVAVLSFLGAMYTAVKFRMGDLTEWVSSTRRVGTLWKAYSRTDMQPRTAAEGVALTMGHCIPAICKGLCRTALAS